MLFAKWARRLAHLSILMLNYSMIEFDVPPDGGLLVVLSGTMGSGKGAVTEELLRSLADFRVGRVTSATTRHRREGEIEGEKYFYMTREEFMRREDLGEFLEVNPAFANGERYGTLSSELLHKLVENDIVIHEVNISGARAIRDLYKEARTREKLLTVFLMPGEPWRDTVLKRIGEDIQNPRDGIRARLKEAEIEISHKDEYDAVVENRDGYLENCVSDIKGLILKQLSLVKIQKQDKI